MNDENLRNTIDRATGLLDAILNRVIEMEPCPGPRQIVAFQSGLLSMEHAVGALGLLENGFYAAAFSLFRPQYENLVRGVWLLHAADNRWVERFREPLTLESARKADRSPMVAKMLDQLGNSSAPSELVAQLKRFRDASWGVLNSFAHGGLHPLSRTATGYPPSLLVDVIRNSNAVTTIAAQLISNSSADRQLMAIVRKIHTDFADVLPNREV